MSDMCIMQPKSAQQQGISGIQNIVFVIMKVVMYEIPWIWILRSLMNLIGLVIIWIAKSAVCTMFI
jgi:hypothetical protein